MTQTTNALDEPQLESDGAEYRCPYCTNTYPDERLTRAHITWADDDSHRNRSGFMPETRIEVLDVDRTVIEERSRHPEELNTNEIPLKAFPDEISESKKRVCRIVVYNPNIDTYAEIHERSEAVLTENGMDPVGYNTVRRWIQEFFLPHSDMSDTEDTANADVSTEFLHTELLENLTEKQRTVITEHVKNPSLSMGELADRADVSRSYPTQIIDEYNDLIDKLQEISDTEDAESDTNIEEGADAMNELSPASKTTEGDTNWTSADTVASVIEPVQDITTNDDETDSDSPGDTENDGPVNGPATAVMSASPPDLFSDATESNDKQEDTANDEVSDSSNQETSRNANSQDGQTSSESGEDVEAVESNDPSDLRGVSDGNQGQSEMIPQESLVDVLDRVQFHRRVAERELEAADSERASSQLAILAELEIELQQLIQ